MLLQVGSQSLATAGYGVAGASAGGERGLVLPGVLGLSTGPERRRGAGRTRQGWSRGSHATQAPPPRQSPPGLDWRGAVWTLKAHRPGQSTVSVAPLLSPPPGSRSQPPVPRRLENFPLPSVRHSQTVLNQLRYPSVLLLVCQDSDQSKPGVRFFHCDEVEVRPRPWKAPRARRVL